MKEFNYVLKDENGIHARPAGMLVKQVSNFESDVKIAKGDKTADAKRIFSLMGLGAKKGDEVHVSISGSDEEKAVKVLEKFFLENF